MNAYYWGLAGDLMLMILFYWLVNHLYRKRKELTLERYYWGKRPNDIIQNQIVNMSGKREREFFDLLYNIYLIMVGWLMLLIVITLSVNHKNIWWKNIGDYCNQIVGLALTIVIGTFTVVGFILSVSKSYYITFSLKDLLEYIKIKEKLNHLFLYMFIILFSYFISPIIENNFSQSLFWSVKCLQPYCFALLVWSSGSACWKLLSVVVSEPRFEYEVLKTVRQKYWMVKEKQKYNCKVENSDAKQCIDKNVSLDGVTKDFAYLIMNCESSVSGLKNIREVKFISIPLFYKNLRWLRFICSVKNNFYCFCIMLGKDMLLAPYFNYKYFGELCFISLIVFILSTVWGCFFLSERNFYFFYDAQNIYLKTKMTKKLVGMYHKRNRRCGCKNFLIDIQNILSFYKYFLIQVENKDLPEKLIVLTINRMKTMNEETGKGNDLKHKMYILIIMMMYYFRYEQNSIKGTDNINLIQELKNNIQEVLEYKEYNIKENDDLRNWMDALISSINRETDKNDLTKLKNPLFSKFQDDLCKTMKASKPTRRVGVRTNSWTI